MQTHHTKSTGRRGYFTSGLEKRREGKKISRKVVGRVHIGGRTSKKTSGYFYNFRGGLTAWIDLMNRSRQPKVDEN